MAPRQREVAVLLMAGKTNAQIAERLGIGVRTAKDHVEGLFSQLNVGNRKEAAALLIERPELLAAESGRYKPLRPYGSEPCELARIWR